jgi:cytoskeletal protein CcmA (bactofilin family)
MWKKTSPDKDWLSDAPQAEEPRPARSAAAATPTPARGTASIGSTIKIRGDISGDEDLVIDGNVEGTISLPKNNITIGANGHVKADIKAVRVVVEGRVTGDLHGTEQVIIRRAGCVEGNLTAPRVALEDGCRFKGSVEMNFDERPAPRADIVTSTKPESETARSSVSTGGGSPSAARPATPSATKAQ